jgi:hypothetical protein
MTNENEDTETNVPSMDKLALIAKPEARKMQKCNTVRKRAITFLTTLKQLGYQRIPLEQAKTIFSQTLGLWDRTTLKAYFGTKAHTTKHLVQRTAIYRTTSTVSNKDIWLSQRVETSPGYLEKMGLVTYELKGQTWFMKLSENAVVVPQLMKVVDESMRDFSLSPYSAVSDVSAEVSMKVTYDRSNELETKQQLKDEREKSGSTETEECRHTMVYLEHLAKASREPEQK